MAGKRLYITVPEEDEELLIYWGTLTGECKGQLTRRLVLAALYAALRDMELLQEYEAGIQARRRARILSGRSS